MRNLSPVGEALRNLARRVPSVRAFDAFGVLCPPSNGNCSPNGDRSLLFFDADHLNVLGSERLAEPFVRFLAREGLLETPP